MAAVSLRAAIVTGHAQSNDVGARWRMSASECQAHAKLQCLHQRPSQLSFVQEREVMDEMACRSLAKKYHALQQASTMSS